MTHGDLGLRAPILRINYIIHARSTNVALTYLHSAINNYAVHHIQTNLYYGAMSVNHTTNNTREQKRGGKEQEGIFVNYPTMHEPWRGGGVALLHHPDAANDARPAAANIVRLRFEIQQTTERRLAHQILKFQLIRDRPTHLLPGRMLQLYNCIPWDQNTSTLQPMQPIM